MAFNVTIKKQKRTYVELYYLDSFLGRIELSDSNRTTQATLDLVMSQNIKIIIKKDTIDKEKSGNYAIED
jgi:hypothetical protein